MMSSVLDIFGGDTRPVLAEEEAVSISLFLLVTLDSKEL